MHAFGFVQYCAWCFGSLARCLQATLLGGDDHDDDVVFSIYGFYEQAMGNARAYNFMFAQFLIRYNK